MSVINKMLRDLDHRANPAAAVQPGPAGLRKGTASISAGKIPAASATGPASRVWLALGLLAVAGAAVGGWLWWSANPVATPVARASAPLGSTAIHDETYPSVAAATASPAVSGSSASVSANAPFDPNAIAQTVASAPEATASDVPIAPTTAVTLRMESSLSARKALDALLSKPTFSQPTTPPPAANARPAGPAATAPTTPPAIAATAPASAPATTPVATTVDLPKARLTASASTPAIGNNTTPVLQRQQQAGGDALAQVQSLWNSGSHDAAMDLMQQSIAAAERGAKAGTAAAPGGNAVLVPLVREMARMQLAEARYSAVWEMLTRLEPLLGNQADLWAIRANAAQRLGRHPDSVRAYMMALQSRPDEQRWLLGTAVSLAALGQTSSAAEMTDKARAVGPVSKDVLAYLRQAGVPLRD